MTVSVIDRRFGRVCLTCTDITDTIEAERKSRLLLEEALRSAGCANQVKTIFLNNISHDIRTPMNAILGYADMLKKHRKDEERCGTYIKYIKDSGEYLLNLINSVLEMARTESGGPELNDGKPWQIESFSKKQEIPSPKEGYAMYRTAISDNGIGMSGEFLTRLFGGLERVRNSAGGKVDGSGLGMGITRHLVELMGGTISAESELGKGTTFTFSIPLKIAEENKYISAQEKQRMPKSDIFKGRRILLAEDNELNAEITTEILGEYGILADWAEDGVVCVHKMETADAGYYDMILMDIQMPNMDGYKAAATIRSLADKRKRQIPIVAMTASVFDADRQSALDAGMDGFLGKPIDIHKLISVLQSIMTE